jgi:predicted permease
MRTLIQDLRYGVRLLMRNPGFTAVAVSTLALGIGANTALFSVVHGVLLKPMPYENPEQLVDVYRTTPLDQKEPFSFPDFLDFQRLNRVFSSVAASRWDNFILLNAGEPERLSGERISAEFFPLLNVKPILGRTFLREEDKLGAAPVAVIGDDLWRRKFNSSSSVLGTVLNLNGETYTVVGVIPARMPFFDPLSIDIFVPINLFDNPVFRDRKVRNGTYAVARLKPGVTLAQAREDMDVTARNLAAAYPNDDEYTGVNVVPIKEDTVGDVRSTLLVLMGAVGFVLLIACANVANLLLSRTTARAREFAIRRALGAQKIRLICQLLTESVLLAFTGGLLGLMVAYWSTKGVLANLPAFFPRTGEIRLDAPVLFFTFAAAILTGIVFGLAPALKTYRADISIGLKAGGRSSTGAGHRVQAVLVVAELALSVVLLAGAGLMIRSVAEIWKVNPGFNPHNALTFGLTLSASQRTEVSIQRQAFHEVIAKIESVPGIIAASGIGGGPPIGDAAAQMPFWIEGKPKPSSQNEMSIGIWYAVQPDYLKAMEIPLLRGRFISPEDTENSRSVVVIDENFAREFFPNEDPIGTQIDTDLMGPLLHSEIVGIVGHTKQMGLNDTARRDREGQFYYAISQLPDRIVKHFTGFDVVVRTSGDPLASVGALRAAFRQFDPDQVLFEFKSLDAMVSETVASQRFAMILLAIFAGLALMLSAVGVYGVISYLVSERTREIGVRIALGAQRSDVFRLILGDGARLAVFGVAIGLAASLGLTRLLTKMLFGVRATDPLTLAVVIVVLTGVAFLACYIPARRAVRVDPMIALRYE